MNTSGVNADNKNWFLRHLDAIIIGIFAAQPLMDMLSFVLDVTGSGNKISLAVRFAMLVFVALLGFCISDRKKLYLIYAAACAALLAGHVAACLQQGYRDPVGDIANFVRVAQMPLFAMCFISFLRRGDRIYKAVETGLWVNFAIITVSVVLSVITGTYKPTYLDSNLGVLGWYSTSNAQSAIMSILTPLLVMLAYRSKNDKLLIATTAAAFAQLYFLGTRLAFMAMAVTLGGLVIVMLLRREFKWKPVIIVGVCFLACCAFVKVSPMYKNQQVYNSAMNSKQGDANVMMSWQLDGEDFSHIDWDHISAAKKKHILTIIYTYYSTKYLVARYGIDDVLEAYDYTHEITDITGTRHQKIIFCQLLMDEQDSTLSRLFGMELSRMSFAGKNYDVENDFHGVYFLYGWTGLAMMIAFIGYFIYLIVKALASNWKKYFTLEAGAFGMAFCIALIYAYNTAGVLRRPNSSFYLSVLLAVIYYLTMLRDYGAQTPGELKQ